MPNASTSQNKGKNSKETQRTQQSSTRQGSNSMGSNPPSNGYNNSKSQNDAGQMGSR